MDRYWVEATFTLAREPEPITYGPNKTLYYLVGVEDGRWRIFETATATWSLPDIGPADRRAVVMSVDEARAVVTSGDGPLKLFPTALPTGSFVAEVAPNIVVLEDLLHGIRVNLSVAVHNPPPPTQRGTQAQLAFRSDGSAFYQQNDATVPEALRLLMWKEPEVPDCEQCEHLLSVSGVDEQAFWAIARSLR